MARYTIHYTAFPNNAEATEYSQNSARRGAYIGCFLFIWSLLALGFYVDELLSLFTLKNITSFLQSLGILSSLVFSFILCFVWQTILVKAKCQMILVSYCTSSPTFSVSEATAAIKKNRRQKATRAILIGAFFYFVAIGASIAICGIISSDEMGSLGNETQLWSTIGLISLSTISVAVSLLWSKYRREIPDRVFDICRTCNVSLRPGETCTKCAERAMTQQFVQSVMLAHQKSEAQQKQQTATPASISGEDSWLCGNCKRRNIGSSAKCWNCGNPFIAE